MDKNKSIFDMLFEDKFSDKLSKSDARDSEKYGGEGETLGSRYKRFADRWIQEETDAYNKIYAAAQEGASDTAKEAANESLKALASTYKGFNKYYKDLMKDMSEADKAAAKFILYNRKKDLRDLAREYDARMQDMQGSTSAWETKFSESVEGLRGKLNDLNEVIKLNELAKSTAEVSNNAAELQESWEKFSGLSEEQWSNLYDRSQQVAKEMDHTVSSLDVLENMKDIQLELNLDVNDTDAIQKYGEIYTRYKALTGLQSDSLVEIQKEARSLYDDEDEQEQYFERTVNQIMALQKSGMLGKEGAEGAINAYNNYASSLDQQYSNNPEEWEQNMNEIMAIYTASAHQNNEALTQMFEKLPTLSASDLGDYGGALVQQAQQMYSSGDYLGASKYLYQQLSNLQNSNSQKDVMTRNTILNALGVDENQLQATKLDWNKFESDYNKALTAGTDNPDLTKTYQDKMVSAVERIHNSFQSSDAAQFFNKLQNLTGVSLSDMVSGATLIMDSLSTIASVAQMIQTLKLGKGLFKDLLKDGGFTEASTALIGSSSALDGSAAALNEAAAALSASAMGKGINIPGVGGAGTAGGTILPSLPTGSGSSEVLQLPGKVGTDVAGGVVGTTTVVDAATGEVTSAEILGAGGTAGGTAGLMGAIGTAVTIAAIAVPAAIAIKSAINDSNAKKEGEAINDTAEDVINDYNKSGDFDKNSTLNTLKEASSNLNNQAGKWFSNYNWSKQKDEDKEHVSELQDIAKENMSESDYYSNAVQMYAEEREKYFEKAKEHPWMYGKAGAYQDLASYLMNNYSESEAEKILNSYYGTKDAKISETTQYDSFSGAAISTSYDDSWIKQAEENKSYQDKKDSIKNGTYDGSYANGLFNVPYDGYIAQLHKNEAVLTSSDADTWRSNQEAGWNDQSQSELMTKISNQLSTNNAGISDDAVKQLIEIIRWAVTEINKNNNENASKNKMSTNDYYNMIARLKFEQDSNYLNQQMIGSSMN